MKVMHFGCGALGRGLTMFSLINSGCEVYAVDAYDALVDALRNNNNTYKLFVQDAEEGNQHQEYQMKEVLSSNRDMDEIKRLLREEIDVITTSTIQENLINVAKIVAEVWNVNDADKKMILLCENLENASGFFKGLLKECSTSPEQEERLMKIKIPNTMVDRGCAKNPNDLTEVFTTEFREIAVDGDIVEDTGIKLIPSVKNIEGIFARKRYLLNTLADSIAFEGIMFNDAGFVEAVLDPRIRNVVLPYMELVKKSLVAGYGLTKQEVEEWAERYKARLGLNLPEKMPGEAKEESGASRDLDNVARNMLRKLSREERFVKPLLILIDKCPEIDLTVGYNLITEIAQREKEINGFTKDELLAKLKEMWATDDAGKVLYDEVAKGIA